MTYDVADGYVLAVSLNASAGPLNNTYAPNETTWKFSGGNWSRVTTTGQLPATYDPGLVYDGKDGYVLLYGGRLMATNATTAPLTNQTWSYLGGVWTNLSSTSSSAPAAVDFPNLVYDAFDKYVLLYDELGLSASPNGTLETTWSYAGGVWTNLTSSAGQPPAGWFGAMTYDARDQYVVYFGGFTLANQLTNATYTFHGGVWTNVTANVSGAPSPRMSFGLTYDSSANEVLLYGGLDQLGVFNASAYSGETWAYANGTWVPLGSNGSMYNPQGMVYDVADNETVLLGSNLSSLVTGTLSVVTWTFSGSSWVVAAPVFASSARVMDVGQSITFRVTESPNGGGLSFSYLGLPPGCTSTDTPQLVCMPTSPGTYHVAVTIRGAAGFLATARTTLEVNPAPAILRIATTLPEGEVGIAVGFNVTATPGTGTLAYSYSGLPTGCATANIANLVCRPAAEGSYAVTARVTDSLGVSAVQEVSLTIAPSLTVASVAPSHAAIDVGQNVSVVTTYGGGVGVVHFEYTGLPAGCATVDSGSFGCRPTSTGAFAIRASATDSLGATAGTTGMISVNPLPEIASFGASSPTTVAGGVVHLTTTVVGGTGPFVFAYQGLPIGCSANGSASVSCSGSASGQYSVRVTATDATGASATRTTTFAVAPSVGPKMQGGAHSLLGASEFQWGLAAGLVGAVIAGIVGANQLRLSRQGARIVDDLRNRAPEEPTTQAGAPQLSGDGLEADR